MRRFSTSGRATLYPKKPSTSELIDWLRALLAAGVDAAAISSDLPYLGVLMKKDKDYAQVQKSMRH